MHTQLLDGDLAAQERALHSIAWAARRMPYGYVPPTWVADVRTDYEQLLAAGEDTGYTHGTALPHEWRQHLTDQVLLLARTWAQACSGPVVYARAVRLGVLTAVRQHQVTSLLRQHAPAGP